MGGETYTAGAATTTMFFSQRVINVWNYLPYNIVCFNNLNAFKRSIVRVDFISFLQCY